MRSALILLLLSAPSDANRLTGPLSGKSDIIQLSAAENSSGYGEFLLPPLDNAMTTAGMRAQDGAAADMVVRVETDGDGGQSGGEGAAPVRLCRISTKVGISPESFAIPAAGTPAFGARASLMTTNPDRQKQWDCLIKLAARTALQNDRPQGLVGVDGQACNRERETVMRLGGNR